MKTLISLVLLSLGAQASYFHDLCSNANATIQKGSGHLEPYFFYSAYDSKTGGMKKVNISREEYNYTFSREKIINEKSECVNGMYSSTKNYLVKVIITHKTNERFFREALLICERYVSGRGPNCD